MSKNFSVNVSPDNDSAAVVLSLNAEKANLSPREARKIAIQLLQDADRMDDQRKHNLRRAKFARDGGHDDLAAQMAELNGFSDEEMGK